MANLSTNARNSVALQQEMFRLAEQEHGLSVSVLHRTRGIPKSTLEGWASGTQMPAWAIGELRLPDDLTSLVLTPYGKHVGTDEEGEGEIDALNCDATEYSHVVAEARLPTSPGGPRIVHSEVAKIKSVARRMTPKARAVAA